MDNRDWELITTLHEKLNITKTAEKLYISQPSLTYRLNKIENELGITIVERHSNGVTFTKEGKILVDYCLKMENEYRELKEKFSILQKEKISSISIGVSTVYAKFYLADILNRFKKDFPSIKINLITGASSQKLPELLKENKVDLLIIRGEILWEEVDYIINEEPYGIVANENFNLNEINKKPWVKHETENTIIQSEKFFLEWWNENYTFPWKGDIMTVNSTEAALNMAEKGIGWTVLPEIHLKQNNRLTFFSLKKKDGSSFLRKTHLLCRNKIGKKIIIKEFIDYVLSSHNSPEK